MFHARNELILIEGRRRTFNLRGIHERVRTRFIRSPCVCGYDALQTHTRTQTQAYAYLRIMVSIIKWDLYHQPNRTEQRAECESVH